MNIDIRFYFSRFMRRLHYFMLVFLAVAAIGITLAFTLPPVFRAEARLLVEAPQIPDELAPSTVSTAGPEILLIIQQKLMTRVHLLDIAQRLKVYEGLAPIDPDKMVEDMRNRIRLRLPDIRDVAAFVSVSFDAPTGKLSAQVTNDIVTTILQDSVALRTESAGQTLEFFKAEVAQLNEKLAQQGARILEFKLANKDALPDSLDYRRARQASQQERLLQMERDLAGLADRRTRLVGLYERTGQVEAVTDGRTPEQRQLQKLTDDLTAALGIYAPENPKVKLLKAQIATMQRVVNNQLGAANPESQDLTAYQVQLADIDGQANFLKDQKVAIEAELIELQASLDATPKNAITLDVLKRDYDNTQTQYNLSADRLSQAATGDRIETMSKGQRITVVEQAAEPNKPASPNRKMIAAGSVVAGAGMGIALVLLLELTNRAIQRPAELVTKLGITPFASVAYIRTHREIWRRRAIITLAFLIVGAGLPLGLFLLHVYYLPMDMLVAWLLDKAGLASIAGQLRQDAGT